VLPPLPRFQKRLLAWYDSHRRDLPWRLPRDAAPGQKLDPYHVLVSEAMLQQTQVATVIPYFHRFLARFPTIESLAAADEQDVLRLWQGLGYYSRARNLHAAARKVVADHSGQLPPTRDALLSLPGIGRYTAGAVASIAFDQRVPILDGNVARVLCRLDAITSDPRSPKTQSLLWRRAEEILPPKRPGNFNSAVMELGALICTPRSPQCLLCPVREHCQAFESALQYKIPAPRAAKPTPLLRRATYCIQHPRHPDRYLIEQRPANGRWANMWQFITVEKGSSPAVSLRLSNTRFLTSVRHALTHRRYEFDVYKAHATSDKFTTDPARPRTWTALDDLSQFPLPRPHLKIAAILRGSHAHSAR